MDEDVLIEFYWHTPIAELPPDALAVYYDQRARMQTAFLVKMAVNARQVEVSGREGQVEMGAQALDERAQAVATRETGVSDAERRLRRTREQLAEVG